MEEGEAPYQDEVDPPEVEVAEVEVTVDNPGELHTALPPRMESWRRRSAAGAILTGIGLGLREALEPKRDEPSILVVASGDLPSDLAVEAELAGFHPSVHVVRIRPWLLESGDPDGVPSAGAGGDAEETP